MTKPRPESTVDTFTAEQVREPFELLRSSNPKTKASMTAIENKYPNPECLLSRSSSRCGKNGEEISSFTLFPNSARHALAIYN